MIALVKDMKRPWLFATPAFLFQIFAVSTRDQTTAANNAAPTCCTKTEAASNRITSARQRLYRNAAEHVPDLGGAG